MYKVGITGGIGSGKTTVCKIFELLGIPVYYADDRAKHLMNTDTVVRDQIIEAFGTDSYTDEGLNRTHIAQIVFKDRAQLSRLNSIVHPAVGRDSDEWFAAQESSYAIKEAALLVETKGYLQLDFLISVSAPEELRISRVVSRDSTSDEEVQRRIKSQLPQSEKDAVADFIIYNDGSRPLISQVLEAHRLLLGKVK